MSNPLVTKTLFGILGAGAVGGTTVVGYRVFKKDSKKEETTMVKDESVVPKQSVMELLKQDKTKTLLGKNLKGSHEDGKAAYEKYRTGDSSKDLNPGGLLEGQTKKSQTGQDAPQEFLDKCESESQKEVVDNKDPIYVNVSTWCTKEVSSIG